MTFIMFDGALSTNIAQLMRFQWLIARLRSQATGEPWLVQGGLDAT